MDSTSDEISGTPPELRETANTTVTKLLPNNLTLTFTVNSVTNTYQPHIQ
jgi:hypothetical protein